MALDLLLTPDVTGALLGAVVGLTLGFSGAGGGIIAVPLLVFGLDLTILQAAPVGLMAVALAAGLGALLGWREGIVRYRAAALIGAFGMLAAPLGLWLAQGLPNPPLLLLFSLLLLYTARRMWQQAKPQAEASGQRRQPCRIDPALGRLLWTRPCARTLAATGLLSGLLSGLLGVGGGFVIVPALSRHTDLEVRSVLATSLAVISLIAIGSITAAALHGTVNWAIALPFSVGALIGLLSGRQLAARRAGSRLQQGFALVCVLVAMLLAARGLGWVAL